MSTQGVRDGFIHFSRQRTETIFFLSRERMLEKERSERLVDLRRDEQLAEAAVEESDTGL